VILATPTLVVIVVIMSVALFCAALFALLGRRKKVAGVLGLTFLLTLLWLNHEFQPWMVTGRAVHISSSRFGQHDFQVWQLKNSSITEPFTTGLFVRKQNGQWRVFMLDFEDTYRPSVTLREDASGVAILEDGEKLGTFDFQQKVLRRGSASFDGATVYSDPPGDWSAKN
jgi:hypothetical protein